MLKFLAILFGIAFIFAGVAGFLPSFTTDGLLFGYFAVDSMHNIVHVVSGVLAIMSATSAKYTRLYFQIFGVVYTIVAVLGFWRGELLMMQMNMADNFLHLGIGVVALFLGFSSKFKHA